MNKTKTTIILGFVFMILLASRGFASASPDCPFFGSNTVTFQPNPSYADNFATSRAYTWGVDYTLAQNEYISFAQISFTQINNYMSDDNILYVNLLQDAAAGLSKTYDSGTGNWFLSQPGSQQLFTFADTDYENPQNFVYTFNCEQLKALNTAFANGNIGLGFDPDAGTYSHFTNDGVTFSFKTKIHAAPEPFSCVLFAVGSGIFGLAARRRKVLA
jgi:hypothetical protein